MGSVAFGSFLIAICQAINHIFDYFRKKLGVLEKTVTWVRILLSMTSCCLFVMEHCIKFMSKNAYVQIALTGCGFCQGAYQALTLFVKHFEYFKFGVTIGFIFMFFGCFLVAALITSSFYVFLTASNQNLESPLAPTTIIALVTIAISYQFLSMVSFTADSIL